MLGSSSGAIVALHLLVRRPEVTKLVAHELPLFPLLPDGDAVFAELDGSAPTFRAWGRWGRSAEFSAHGHRAHTGPAVAVAAVRRKGGPRRRQHRRSGSSTSQSATPAPSADLDALAAAGERLVLGCGRHVPQRARPPGSNELLAARFGRPVAEFPRRARRVRGGARGVRRGAASALGSLRNAVAAAAR